MYFLNNYIGCLCITLICCPLIVYSSSSSQENIVNDWAKTLGEDLTTLGSLTTRSEVISGRCNASVRKKDPEKLLVEIVGNVTRMLNRKMDAIRCIVHTAEEAVENFQENSSTTVSYHSSKYSAANGDPVELPESLEENESIYEPMDFNIDSHFYNIAVNTSYSSVHVPTNLYDLSKIASNAIQWSEKLDEIFRINYESDPALSWQYFGSSTGIMRHYPAMRWVIDASEDAFDCRVRTWYIEAATCTKDIVILLDSSGSMLGMNKHIASLTVYTILKTLSNNDYVNILNYSVAVNYTVPCFKEKLIQATPENIETFKMAVNNIDPEGKSNAEQGLIESFRLLEEYREMRNCTENVQDCSQAIMLITDGVARNFTELISKYNSLKNGTVKPVRIFTYLVGKEINNLQEIASLACDNRGYYTLVSDLETVTEAVFKYVNVIARPLILHRKYPISWTHTYVDTYTHDTKNEHHENEPYRLLTSAAIPAYNKSANISDDVQLLGIAGTDVTIDSIQRLTFPYKLGVNAHAFIVTNNGYVLMHPGLKAMFKNKPTPNYNSIDFTEVQQLDDESQPRRLAKMLLDLRAALIHADDNVTKDVPLKYYYNNMQRVSREKFDFYYQKIEHTPFTMALALPNRFGYYAAEVGGMELYKDLTDDILRNFDGNKWRIHPKWTYCKYHYLEGHEFDTPEKELLHFLKKIKNGTVDLQYQYYASDTSKNNEDSVECDTETKRLQQNDSYCDKELLNMLIFDAKCHIKSFNESWNYPAAAKALFEKYNASLRFVATMSGLTRWEYLFEEEPNVDYDMEFGDYHARAIDETWYKSAVLQHQYDSKSYVFSIPIYPQSTEGILVTGAYAIFLQDNITSAEAPASVAGVQFSHSSLVKNFFVITADTNDCSMCLPCKDQLDCYLIDGSGYILVSPDNEDTGKFFGEIEGCVLNSMLDKNLFERLPIYDYQSLCYRTDIRVTKGSRCNVGFERTSFLHWILNKILWLLFELSLQPSWFSSRHAGAVEEEDEIEIFPATETDELKEDRNHTFFPCDHKKYLYILNQTLFIDDQAPDTELYTVENQGCSRRGYYVSLVPKTNLLLVAVRADKYYVNDIKLSTKPERIIYENDIHHPCQKLELNDLTRSRLSGCFNMHEDEVYITECGYSNAVIHFSSLILISITSLLHFQ